ncbi:unnamed protein product, partial [Allacma fusca]
CNGVKVRTTKRWRNTKPEEIAAVMAGISRDPDRWQSEKNTRRNSLWALVGQNVWPGRRVKDCECLWLRSVYLGNRKLVQDLFRDLVHQPLFGVATPVASSTPRPKAPKFCICGEREGDSDEPMVECNVCRQWFHGVCINERISSVADNTTWSCPHCRGVFGNKFPDNWKDSLPLRRRVADDMTPVPGSSNQLGYLIETINQTDVDEVQPLQQEADENLITQLKSCLETVPSDSQSDSDSEYIRRSKSRVGILDSDSESEQDNRSCLVSSTPKLNDNLERHCPVLTGIQQSQDLDTLEDYTSWELPATIHIQKGWTDFFRDEIGKIVPQCGITFECHKVYHSTTSHFHASGYCKAKDCISFVLTGAAPPTEVEPMCVSMIITGVCRHKYGESFRTRIQNHKRDEVKLKLVTATSASIATELHRKADMIAVNGGNMTSLPARKLLRQMRYEMNVKADFSKEPLHDLQLMVQKDTQDKFPFIRFYASVPKFQVQLIPFCGGNSNQVWTEKSFADLQAD